MRECVVLYLERERPGEREGTESGYQKGLQIAANVLLCVLLPPLFYYLCVHNEGVFVCGIDLYLYEKIDCRNGKMNANGIEEEHINQNRF